MDVEDGLHEVAAAAAGDYENIPRAAAHANDNDNNSNSNNNIILREEGDEEEEQQNQAELPLIHSLEHYIRTRGIAPADEQVQQNADVFYADSHHASKRQIEDARFQEEVHRAAFAEYDMKEQDEKMIRKRFLDTLKGHSIEVLSRKEEDVEERDESCDTCTAAQDVEVENICTVSATFPLDALASACDTVYTMVRSERTHWSRQNSALSDVDSVANDHQSTLDLTNFGSGAVESFLSLIPNFAEDANDEESVSLENVPSHHIVDVCLISHYLQCPSVLEKTIDILKESVDSANCLSICQLSDQLESPSLFEASVSHLIEKLDCIQDHDEWEDFPVTLRNRVVTMRNAVHSSIIGRGQKTSVFFSSSDEFLAIFSDNIREQRERLAEAKRRQNEIIEDRIQNSGSLLSRHRDIYGGSVKDAEIKIERQEHRLQTLETFYKEQKLIFSGGGRGSEIGTGGQNNNGGQEKQPFQLGFS